MTPNRQLSKWIGVITVYRYPFKFSTGLLPANQNWRLRMHQECGEHYPSYLLQRKPLVGDPGMHHGMCCDASQNRYTAVVGKTFPALPAHAQPAILRIWQEAHGIATHLKIKSQHFFNRQQIFKLMAMSCHKLNGYPNTDPQNFHQAKRPIALSSRNGTIRLVVRTRTIIMISYHFIQDTAWGSRRSNQPLR